MLKFYLDSDAVDKQNCIPFLFPHLGKHPHRLPHLAHTFDEWAEIGQKHYTLTKNIEEADYALMPYDLQKLTNHQNEFNNLLTLAKKHNKKLVCFHTGDRCHEANYQGAIIFKIAHYSFVQNPDEIAFPCYTNDVLKETGTPFSTRPYTETPTLGFCGWSQPTKLQTKIAMRLRNTAINIISLFKGKQYQSKKKGVYFRKKATDILSKSKLLTINFLLRTHYFGGQFPAPTSQQSLETVRKEYLDNIINSDYTLCIRGDANSSVRFFEVMAAGRIPFIIDTATVLPFAQYVDYSFIPKVEFFDMKNADRALLQHHQQNKDAFEKHQKRCRQIWEDHLSPTGSFKTALKLLQDRLA